MCERVGEGVGVWEGVRGVGGCEGVGMWECGSV